MMDFKTASVDIVSCNFVVKPLGHVGRLRNHYSMKRIP